MNRKTIMYIGILLIVSVIVSVTYFSYAYFTRKDEEHGKLNIVAGTLNYKIESDDLTNNSITLSSKTNKELVINVTSLNTIESKYELYYETDNDSVLVGYMEDTIDMPTGTINSGSTKTIKILIKNNTNANATITFSVKGGFIDKTFTVNGISITEELNLCRYVAGDYWEFNYNGINGPEGSVQSFDVPCDGKYRLQVYGAQGGKIAYCSAGGAGGYSVGETSLTEGNKLAVVVGGMGYSNSGGYNGGGAGGNQNNQQGAGGGGATHIAFYNASYGVLSSYGNAATAAPYLLIVAGGGSGCGSDLTAKYSATPGTGGGSSGGQGVNYGNNTFCVGTGASQSAGGYNMQTSSCATGSFGLGAPYCNGSYGGNGGGGGYYGGGGSCRGHAGGGGGSGYIKSGLTSTSSSNGQRSGNGYARITYLGD